MPKEKTVQSGTTRGGVRYTPDNPPPPTKQPEKKRRTSAPTEPTKEPEPE